jgi:hypothetical protein
VYEIANVEFSEHGVWTAEIEADIAEHGKQRATTPIPVGDTHRAIAVGDKAPASVNPTLANRGKLPLKAVDSRAQGDTVPDPELHETTIKEALAAKRPLVVAVTTPVYCTSRFCGPITETVAEVSKNYDDVTFIHVEVWGDYDAQQLNQAAAEWIQLGGEGGNEPWLFVVGRDGVVKARFDNVLTREELTTAIEQYAK